MLIAREKKKNNIVEYILYMWHIEDIIRASRLDIKTIEKQMIPNGKLSKTEEEETHIWYADLIEKMKEEEIEQSGHFSFVKTIIADLEWLHLSLLKDQNEIKYRELYRWAQPNIEHLRNKTIHKQAGEIEICLIGLYGLLVLRMKKNTITEETNYALQTFRNLLAFLTTKYHGK
jgi:hypothetical protein